MIRLRPILLTLLLLLTIGTVYSQPMPVILKSFDIEIVDYNTVIAKWQTTLEINNSHFYLALQNEKGDTQVIRIESQAEEGSGFEYSVIIGSCTGGTWLAWLEQYDIDGTATIYDELKVTFTMEGNITSTKEYNLYHNYIEIPGKIEVFNNQGQRIDEFTDSKQLNLPSGIYFFRGENVKLKLYIQQ